MCVCLLYHQIYRSERIELKFGVVVAFDHESVYVHWYFRTYINPLATDVQSLEYLVFAKKGNFWSVCHGLNFDLIRFKIGAGLGCLTAIITTSTQIDT